MNPDHAVDVYSNFVTGELMFIRRRDNSLFVLPNANDAKKIGHAAFEAIEPNISNELSWTKIGPDWCVEWNHLDIVVAWRDSGEMVIATPLCEWGKAPDIKIANQPSYLEFGNAILEQLRYAKAKREENA